MRTPLTVAGAAFASLLFTLPALAADQGAGAQQAAPSEKPATEAQTQAVDPGAVGAGPSAGPSRTGTQQAAPSPVPAPQATPQGVEARTEHKQ
ncbi:MAG: hypothetical protein JO047_15545 [Alphaproteobacteria bacterium]|nr:hypothetical protein [Alphaproteobacteria bacterium]